MTLFSIENLAQSDCKSTRCSPQPASQPDYGIFSPRRPRLVKAAKCREQLRSGEPQRRETPRVHPRSPIAPPSTKKPPHSYIALIAMAILHTPEKRLLLCDIYEYIMKRFPFFKDNERSWRNQHPPQPLPQRVLHQGRPQRRRTRALLGHPSRPISRTLHAGTTGDDRRGRRVRASAVFSVRVPDHLRQSSPRRVRADDIYPDRCHPEVAARHAPGFPPTQRRSCPVPSGRSSAHHSILRFLR